MIGKMGSGRAAQLLTHHAKRLRRSAERRDQLVAEALEILLAQRGQLLTEKHGPPRDFSIAPRREGNAL